MASHRTTGLPGGRPPLIQAVVWSLLLASGDHAPLAAASATIPASPLPQHARLALIGDSITEQMLYTRYVEAYLLACAGRTDLSVFQFGWGGETAATVLNRIDRGDLDAFHPTAVTIAYGANDGGSQTWADWMRVMWTGRITAVLTAVEKRYPGITPQSVICSPTWFELNRDGTNASGVAASNDTLGRFRAIDITVAQARGCGFADLRQRMQESSTAARGVLGPAYRIGGTDGVHAGPNGHLLMAYEILTALRMSGDIATITVDSLSAASVTASPGHTVVSHADGSITLSSSRYPFCTDSDHATAADRLSTILPFVPFTSELNRFMLVIAHCDAPSATITWGGESHNFTRAELAAGVNLAAAFRHTPFDGAFATLMERITTQEVKERDMIKAAGDATAPQKGWTDADVTARNALDRSTHDAIVPVTHTIRIVPNTGTGALPPHLSDVSATGMVGIALSVPVTGADGQVAFAATGLPDGLHLDAASGVISGVPTTAVITQVVHVTATTAAGTATAAVTLTIQPAVPVPRITSALTLAGVVGAPLSYHITVFGTATKYYATGLPAGLSLVSTTGEIRGVPSASGTASVLISAENAGGNGPAVTLTITTAGNRP